MSGPQELSVALLSSHLGHVMGYFLFLHQLCFQIDLFPLFCLEPFLVTKTRKKKDKKVEILLVPLAGSSQDHHPAFPRNLIHSFFPVTPRFLQGPAWESSPRCRCTHRHTHTSVCTCCLPKSISPLDRDYFSKKISHFILCI